MFSGIYREKIGTRPIVPKYIEQTYWKEIVNLKLYNYCVQSLQNEQISFISSKSEYFQFQGEFRSNLACYYLICEF